MRAEARLSKEARTERRWECIANLTGKNSMENAKLQLRCGSGIKLLGRLLYIFS